MSGFFACLCDCDAGQSLLQNKKLAFLSLAVYYYSIMMKEEPEMLNNEDYNNEEYEAQIITLEDDLGNEQEFEYLDTVEFDSDEYIILLPVSEEEEEDAEVMILRVDSLDDENELYSGVEDEEILRAVFDIFKERYKDDFDFE